MNVRTDLWNYRVASLLEIIIVKATVDILIADNSSHVIESQEKSTLFTRDDIW